MPRLHTGTRGSPAAVGASPSEAFGMMDRCDELMDQLAEAEKEVEQAAEVRSLLDLS